MQKFHFNLISFVSLSCALMLLLQILFFVPTQARIPAKFHSANVSSIVPLSPESSHSQAISVAMSPDQLGAYFFLDSEKPSRQAAVINLQPEKKKAPEPLIASELSLIGRVVVNQAPAWALFDKKRNMSFTIAVGESWADWQCVVVDSRGIVLKKKEDLFFVPFTK